MQALAKNISEEGADCPVVWSPGKCVHCDVCIRTCPNAASPKIQYMEAKEVFKEIEKNIPFIRGITVSGGECTLYPEFLTELFILSKQAELSCYIDSNGCVDLSAQTELMEHCDKVMLDVKAWDEEVFFRLTGGRNGTVKNNLLYLAQHRKLEEVRIVCIEPEVDVENVISGIAESVKEYLDEFTLKLIAFRNHGVRSGLSDRETPSLERMEKWERLAKSKGFSNIRIV